MKNRVLSFVASLCFIIVTIVTCIDYWSFQKEFYREEYIKYDNAKVIGVTQEDLDDVTHVLLDYILDNREDLVVEKEVFGVNREIFNEKEKLHMVDVKNLYLNAIKVRNVSFCIMLICLLLLKFDLKEIYKPFKSAFLFMVAFLLAISFYALIDFDHFWIQFHYIFFTNELFFLNPNTDILIMMVPGGFFTDLVFRIILSVGLILSLSFAAIKQCYEG